jgi:hypothetical protein
MLCCKESNKKTRVAAYELLVQVPGRAGSMAQHSTHNSTA